MVVDDASRVTRTAAPAAWPRGVLRRSYPAAIAVVVIVMAAAVTIPIAILVVLSLQTSTILGRSGLSFSNYVELFHQRDTLIALRNTVIFTAGGAILSVVLGTAMAWAVTSVNVPGRKILRVVPVLVLVLPPLIKDPTWIVLFSPTTGLVNIVLRHLPGVHHAVFNVFSMPGMITVVGVFSAPYAYIIMLAPFSAIDRSFVEASRMSGARLRTTLFRILIPMILPALMSAATLLVIVIASAFETPVIIGLPASIKTFMSQTYQLVNSPVQGLNSAAAQGCLYLVLTGAMVVFYLLATRNERRFVAVAGRGHEHVVLEAPVLRHVLAAFVGIYCLIGFVAPLVLTILMSFIPFYSTVNGNPFAHFTLDNYREVFTTPDIVSGIVTSTVLAAAVSVGVVLAGGLLAVIALKSKARFRRACEFIAMAPIAIPALIYSVGLLLTVLSLPGLAKVAYGSKALMFVAEVVIFLPVVMRLLSSALIQIQDELLEASRMSGAATLRTVFSVLVPLVRPAVMYAAAVIFVLSYRELGAVVFLVANNSTVVPYLSFNAWIAGGYPTLAALNMVTLLAPIVLICVVFAFGRIGRGSPSRNRARRRVALRSVPATEAR